VCNCFIMPHTAVLIPNRRVLLTLHVIMYKCTLQSDSTP